MNEQNFESSKNTINQLITGLEKIVRGRTDTIKLVVAALIADGHVLLEDYPGSGKTTLTKTLGGLIAKDANSSQQIQSFRRVQFTPDLLPGDILGVTIFDSKSGNFRFVEGPIFAHIVLADEINRTGPKVQAAFLECLAEKQVTIDNQTHKLDELFFVVGTQNPLDIAGTYPLPLVQLDRFLFKVPMSYVDKKTEVEILKDHHNIVNNLEGIQAVCSRQDILDARRACQSITINDNIRDAIVDIIQATRNNPILQFGVSTRAGLMLQTAVKSWALLNGRNYAIEDDLKQIAEYVLLHRMKFTAGAGKPQEAFAEFIRPHMEKLISSAF